MVPENIKKACELAKDPGEGMYYNDGKPSCFIAQLVEVEGLNIHLGEGQTFDQHDIPELNKYGVETLQQLQDYWDGSKERTNKELLEYAEEFF
jgi:hypothetical protein